MQGLKFILLSFAFCLNLLAFDFSTVDDWTYTTSVKNSFLPVDVSASPADVVVLDDKFLQIGDDVYSYTGFSPVVFNVELLKNNGFFLENKSKEASKKLFHYGGFEQSSVVCQMDGSEYLSCSKNDYNSQLGVNSDFKSVNFSYYLYTIISPFRSCKSNETFDPDSKQCYRDCSKDGGINKIGLPNGGCIDCSGEKTAMSVLNCFCLASGHGSGKHYSYKKDVDSSASPCSLVGECIDGELVNSFFDPSCKPDDKPDPKPDENKTKPDPKPDNSNPDPKPDPNNPNPGGDGGGGNSGGGGNGGGSEDNPNPGGGSGDNPKPNPNPGGGSGGGGNGNNKDGEAKFNKSDFDDGDLDRERSGLYSGIAKHINDNFSKFDGIREGVDQFIKNVQGKGFETVKTSIKSKCPMKKEIPLPNGGSKDITVDLCEYVSPVSEISYYAFYVGFAVGGFLLFLKLLIFSF